MRSTNAVIAALVATVTMLAVSACGSATTPNADSDQTPTTPVTASVPDTTEPTTGAPETNPSTTTEPSPPPTEEPTAETGFGQSDADFRTLLSTTWSAERFITVGPLDEVPAGSTAGFRFEDETTIVVDTGCNTGSGPVSFGPGGTFTVGPLTLTEVACEDDVEEKMLTLFELDLVWSVNGDQLTIYPLSVTDLGLILRDAATIDDTPTTTPSAEDTIAEARAAVIAAEAVARVTVDNSFGGQPTFAEIAVVSRFGVPDEHEMLTVGANAGPFTDAERAAVEAALAPVRVRWTDDPQDPSVVVAQQAGQLSAILTLSEPVIDGDTATIVSALVCGGLCGIGGAAVLERQGDGDWVVTDRPGPQWMS